MSMDLLKRHIVLSRMPQVTSDVKFLTAFEEKKHPIAQANAPLNTKRQYVNDLVTSRVAGELEMVKQEDIELMDVSPDQLVSVSAALIPFLETMMPTEH